MRIKDYISYSQYTLFRSSPGQYKKIYIDGRKLHTKYLSFGSMIAEALESGEAQTKKIRKTLDSLPPVDEREKEIRADFSGIPLLGKLDGFTRKGPRVDEYKTGKIPWNQSKVDKFEQLTFYAILVSLKYEIPIGDIKIFLHWIETYEDTDGHIYMTGRVFPFETRRTTKDILNFYPKVKKAWIGIELLINSVI